MSSCIPITTSEMSSLYIALASNEGHQVVRCYVAFLPPATKLGQGYIFSQACVILFTGGGGVGAWSRGGVHGPGGVCMVRGGAWSPPETATAAGGTHPTGMHSCFSFFFEYCALIIQRCKQTNSATSLNMFHQVFSFFRRGK